MKHFLTTYAMLFIGVISLTCALVGCPKGWDDPNPAAFKPSKDLPCGVLGVPCTNAQGGKTSFCCDEGETCGMSLGSVGCPADACCFIAPFDPSPMYSASRSDAGASDGGETLFLRVRVTHKQRPVP
jgi:hypothetical protein